MLNPRQRLTAVAVALGSAGLMLATAPSAFADNTVVQTVTGGSRTASVADLTLNPVPTSHTSQSNPGTMVLTADDSTGTGAGWNVTIQSSTFVYSGPNNGTSIPAANFSLTSAEAPVVIAGQAVDPTGGPKVPTPSPAGPLDTPRKTVQASADFGQGTYRQSLGVSLLVPAHSRVGTYTATLTTTISAGP